MYRAGLRVSEALSLHPKDVDRSRGTIRVLQGKGGRPRTVGLDPEAFAVLERWLDARAQRGLKGRHRIFCALNGKPCRLRTSVPSYHGSRTAPGSKSAFTLTPSGTLTLRNWRVSACQ